MKKLTAVILALACVLVMAGCTSNSIKGIDKAAEIEAVKYDISNGVRIGRVSITEETCIAHIIDNLNSLKLKKMKSNDPTVLEYKLTFKNANGDKIITVSIPVNDWIGYDGYFHSISNGELNRAYLAGLFGITE